MTFSADMIESSPPTAAFLSRLEEERRVNVYFVPGTNKFGQKTYAYALASAALHDQFIDAVKHFGTIPDFAVIVEIGIGEPSEEIKAKIKAYYGFDHDYHANNDNFSGQ